MRYSLIITTHLRPFTLRRALQSVLAQAAELLAQLEIIVVADALDAASATLLAELLRQQDVFIKRNGAPGPALSRNAGLDIARGEWILFLDDDDSWQPHHLQTLDAVLHAEPRAASIWYSDSLFVYEDRGPDHGSSAGIRFEREATLNLAAHDPAQLFVKNFIPNNALAFHHSVLADIRVDAHLASQEDWDFLLGAITRSPGGALPRYYPGGGPVVHKDTTPGTRRSTQEDSKNTTVILDFLHVYRRWRAPTPELRQQRQGVLQTVGLNLPTEWF